MAEQVGAHWSPSPGFNRHAEQTIVDHVDMREKPAYYISEFDLVVSDKTILKENAKFGGQLHLWRNEFGRRAKPGNASLHWCLKPNMVQIGLVMFWEMLTQRRTDIADPKNLYKTSTKSANRTSRTDFQT